MFLNDSSGDGLFQMLANMNTYGTILSLTALKCWQLLMVYLLYYNTLPGKKISRKCLDENKKKSARLHLKSVIKAYKSGKHKKNIFKVNFIKFKLIVVT